MPLAPEPAMPGLLDLLTIDARRPSSADSTTDGPSGAAATPGEARSGPTGSGRAARRLWVEVTP